MEDITLDAEQARVASEPVGSCLLVLAGPGAGKSQVVAERCRQLVDDGTYPDEILAVSFSNAAVDVLRDRTEEASDTGDRVDVTTLDALAARIRLEFEPSDPIFTGYEASIVRATELVLEGGQTPLDDVRHVIVDEAQDVVGVRADFVLAILGRVRENNAGFTVLGDPMQGIYDFQRRDADTHIGLVELLRKKLAPDEVSLAGEYRSKTPDARRVSSLRSDLTHLSPSACLSRLREVVDDLAPLGQLDEDAVATIRRWPGTTAFLCDTNARAGLVVDALWGLGMGAERAASRAEAALAPWLARVLEDDPGPSMSFTDFETAASVYGIDDIPGKWRAMMRSAGSRRFLDKRSLAVGLSQRRCPPELLRSPESSVVVSTVHRAKGLEFDNVVLVDPGDWYEEDNGEDAASKRLFVALSRSRSHLTTVRGVDTRGWAKRNGSAWLLRGFRGGTRAVLMEPQWCRELGPCSTDLRSAVGREVEWRRGEDLTSVDGGTVPSWDATVDGVPIARTSEVFGSVVRQLSRSKVPALRGARVEGTESVLGQAQQAGRGVHGLWVGARVGGPVAFEWR